MKIVVASRNPVKIGAAKQAFETLFPNESLEVTGVNVDSGAGDQPDSDKATRQGARMRALNSRQAEPNADFWVGLEGGVEIIDGQLMAFAWMAVQGGGAYGLLTDGLYTREGIYAQTMIIALTPFVNPLYPQSHTQQKKYTWH